jgi:DUF971 family protein
MITELKQAVLIGEEFALLFGDDSELYLPLAMLRRACPCAGCQGEPDAMGRVVRPKVDYKENSFQLLKFERVGGYAIQFYWADMHQTGIYSFSYLKKLGAML